MTLCSARMRILLTRHGLLTMGLAAGVALGMLIPARLVPSYSALFRPEIDPLRVIPALVIAAGLGFAFASSRAINNGEVEKFALVFGLRVLLLLVSAYFFTPQDELILHAHATQLNCCSEDRLFPLFLQGEGYVGVIAVLYRLFGSNLLVARLFNAFLGSVIPFLVYDIAKRIWNDSPTARRAFMISGFFPPLLIFSILNLKETSVLFLLLTTIWLLLVPRLAISTRFVASLTAVAATYALRGAWVLFPLVAIAAFIFLGGVSEWKRGRWSRRLAFGALGVLLLLLPLYPIVQGAVEHAGRRLFIGATAATPTGAATASTTAQLLGPSLTSPIGLLAQVARAPLSPPPAAFVIEPSWDGFVESISALSFYLTIPFAVVGFLSSRRNPRVLIVGLVAGAMMVVSGLSLLLGLNIARHSIPTFGLVALLGARGLGSDRRYGWIVGAWAVVATAYTTAYVLLRG